MFIHRKSYCTICDVSCSSSTQLEQHNRGKKHKQLERKTCDVKNPENLHDSLKLNLYCGNCGSKQAWDIETSDKQGLTAKQDENGCFVLSKVTSGVTQGCIRFTGRSNSRCSVCDKQIMRSHISAVCVHCNALLGLNWTSQIRCTNVDGTARKRFLPPVEQCSDSVITQADSKINKSSMSCGKYLHGAIAGRLINVDGRVPEEAFVKGSGDCYGFVMVH